MQVVHKGFDTYDIAIQGNIDMALFEELMAAKELAQDRNADVLVRLNSVAVHVAKSGANGYQLRLSTGPQGAIWMIKRPKASDPWGIFASFRSLGLAIGGLEAAKRQMAEMLDALGVVISPLAHSINRVDIAVDLFAPEFLLDPDHFVMLSRTRKAAHDTGDGMRIEGTSGRVTGVTIGGMPRREVTIYDKRLEVIQKQKPAWWEIWNRNRRQAGMSPLDPSDRGMSQVWRVELRAGKQHLKDKWGIRSFFDLEDRLGDLYAAALDELRYAQPASDANRSRWPEDPIWQTVRGVIDEALFDFTSNATPDQVRRVNRMAHSRMMREQIFGTIATLAVVDGVTPDGFSTYAKGLGTEFSLRAKESPDEIAERMGKAMERYAFL
jgi:hypothetical protein